MPSTHQDLTATRSGTLPSRPGLKETAMAGCAVSMFGLWQSGDRDCPRSVDWLRRSAANGHPPACTALALLILEQDPGNADEALSLLHGAIAAGCPDAHAELLSATATLTQDQSTRSAAVAGLRKLADQGDMTAATLLGRLLSRPDFRDHCQRVGEAHALLSAAAQSGNAYAQHLLGAMHAQGMAAAWCNTTSFRWFLRAAQQGDREAALKVARRYLTGRGVAQDLSKALFWLRIGLRPSASKRRDGAILNLSRVLGLSVDRISDSLGIERSRATLLDAGAWLPMRETALS